MSEVKINLFVKIQEARCRLQDLNLKKTGQNKFAGYSYFELGDILPAVNNINRELGLCTHVTFDNDFAKLTIFDVDSDKSLEFTSPMAKATLKGAHDIQNLGATETYQRRYLYMSAYEIVECDAVDSSKGKVIELPELLPDTDTWKNAISHMVKNGITLDKVQSKYRISDDNKVKILEGVSTLKAEVDDA
jgi:hypothetical protein